MAVACPSCFIDLPENVRSCPECATVLPDANPSSQDSAERRLLSVVFSDLVGSTRLSQTLDPEDMRDLLAAYQQACVRVIERWGGHVAQYLGDGILVYFGYPAGHEDDARRAVGAALEIAEVVPQVRAPQPAGTLMVRIGVHTGMTVVGAVGSGQRRENLAVGGAPNVAARIQTVAAPNTVVVTDSTRRLVHGFYSCEPIAQELGGVVSQTQLYRVVGATGAARSIDAAAAVGLTQFVGRVTELSTLRNLWSRAIEGNTSSVLIEGEAGIGKSRLVQVLKAHVARGPARVVEWHCSPDAQGTPLRPVAEAIARQMNIVDDDSSEERLLKLERGLAGSVPPGDEAVSLMASLLSIPLGRQRRPPETTPQSIRRRMLDTLLDILQTLSSEEPLLLVVEDLHWADPSTLELIGLAIERIRKARFLVVLTTRPEFQPPWEEPLKPVELRLARLPAAEVEQMIREVVHRRELPSDVLEELTERSEGVPLFVEELTRAVLESGVLAERGDRYELLSPLEATHIPSSIQASLMARLDRLGSSKRIAVVGSALGRSFSYEMIRAVDDASDIDLQRGLDELVKADLLHVVGEPPDAHWTFKHALVRDAAYDSSLRKTRRQLHERIASALVERFPETATAQPELVAHHFSHAGAASRAVPHWITAGQQALSRSANHEAVVCLTRGLDAVSQLAESEVGANAELTMRVLLGPALMAVKGFSHADVVSSYTRAHELVRRIEDAPQMFAVLWGLWAQYFVGGQLASARETAEQVMRMARSSGDPGHVPPAHNALGFVECYTAHYPETVKLVEEGLAHFHAERERKNILTFQFASSLALINMGATALWMLGKPDQARAMAARSQPLAETLRHPPSSAFAISSSSWFLQLSGDAEQVKQVVEIVSGLSKDEGFALWPPLVSVFGGWARMAEGDIEGGADEMLKSFRRYRGIGGGILRTHAFALLGEGLLEAGRIGEALSTVEEAIENAHATGEVHFEPELHRVKGLALAKRSRVEGGSLDEARAALELALGLAREQQARWLELRAAISLARIFGAQGETNRAIELLAPVHASITEGADTREMMEAAALLAELRSA